MGIGVRAQYEEFKGECFLCKLCHEAGVSYPGAFPLFMQNWPSNTDILLVLETPNKTDTFDKDKGFMTVSNDTDESGKLLMKLFTEELCGDVSTHLFMTNSVLCLPKINIEGKYKVTRRHQINCSKWLKLLIDTFQPKIVCTVGFEAFQATKFLEKHDKHMSKLRDVVADPINWYGRILYPVFHTGQRGRKPPNPNGRPVELQKSDWRKLQQIYNSI